MAEDPGTVLLDDGTTVVDLSRPRQGTRHLILFGVEAASGREVAVKIELLPGALEPERRALEWLGAHGGPAPRLRCAGRVVSAENRGAACLVSDRVEGEPPRSLPGWGRLGRALARLSELPWRGSGLEVRDHAAFLADHERRLGDLGAALGSDLRAKLPAVPRSYPDSPTVVTHGDPGPGNFLDDGAAGTLIDWEDALASPRGLDLGRAAFIALLGSGPEGYVAEDGAARARAVTAGFLAEGGDRTPDAGELTWWLGVAGVQFAHRRLERAGAARLAAALTALAVLAAGLLVAGALAATSGGAGRGRLVEVPLSPQTDRVHTAPAIWDLAADPTGGTLAAVDDPSLGLGLFAVARFRPGGTLDRGFGSSGFARLRMRGRPQAKAVAVQPDGAILVAGYALRLGGVARPILARFRPGGSLDPSFGDGGVVSPELANEQPFESEAPQAVAVAPDGRIFVAGSTEEEGVGKSGRDPAGFVAAYEPDGSIDTGFGAAGRVYFRGAHQGPGNQYTGLKAIQVMADGRILVAGFRQDELFLARLTPDGQPDPTFGGGSGEVTLATDEAGGCYDLCWASTPLALLPDGRIVTVASAFPDLPKIVRLLPDGTRDPSFGNHGVVRIRAGTRFLAFDMALQGQRIVVVGWEAIQGERVRLAFGVQRYLPSGRIDRGFGRLGVDSRDRGPDSVALAALSEPGGRVLVGGGVSKPGHFHRLALVEYPPLTSR